MRVLVGLRGGFHPIFLSHHPWVGVVVLMVVIGLLLYRNRQSR